MERGITHEKTRHHGKDALPHEVSTPHFVPSRRKCRRRMRIFLCPVRLKRQMLGIWPVKVSWGCDFYGFRIGHEETRGRVSKT